MTNDLATQAMPDFRQKSFRTTYTSIVSRNMHVASSYMMSLTALTLGMGCTFKRFRDDDKDKQNPYRLPTLYSVDSGTSTVDFDASLCLSKLSKTTQALTKSKVHARREFAAAGIPTPAGGLAWFANMSVLDSLAQANVKRFLLKPNKGSLAKGVMADITIEQARAHLAAHPGEAFIAEQYVIGTEYRIYVVGGKFVGWFAVLRDHVVGDGKHSIGELRQQRLRAERNNPYVNTEAEFEARRKQLLRRMKIDMTRIPRKNETVWLSDVKIPNWHLGVFAPPPAGEDVKKLASDVARCLKADFIAIDAIDIPGAGIVVLEANVKPGFTASCFPMNAPWNLHLPEAFLNNSIATDESKVRRLERYDFLNLIKDYLTNDEVMSFNARDYATFAQDA